MVRPGAPTCAGPSGEKEKEHCPTAAAPGGFSRTGGIAEANEFPRLAGLHPIYIARQLYLFKDGFRNGPDAQLMKKPVEKLADEDIVAIAAYLASLPPVK